MSENNRGWTKGPDSHELYVEAMEAKAQSELSPAPCSAPTLTELLQQYVSASASWNRSINMKLSLKTRTARGKKSETAFRKLQAAIVKAQNEKVS